MLLLNVLILLVLVAGHTELIVMLVNRVDSLPISRPKLHRFRMVADLLIVTFPVLLVWFVGLRGPTVLLGGHWSDLAAGWMIYLGLCGFGVAAIGASIVRWQVRRPPTVQLSNHSQTVDIAERLGYAPWGKEKQGFLTWLPANQALKVQVSDKRYVLPRVPQAWHDLSILHLTDTHFIGNVDRSFFEEVGRLAAEMRPDLIVFTGDLLDNLELLPWLGATFGRLTAPLGCYYSLGNHDWFYGADEIRQEFDRAGWINTAGRSTVLECRGHRLEIAGTELPWMGAHPAFTGGPDAFRILLSHTPDNFAWARAQGADLMLSGHNHGGQIVFPVFGPIFAPSRHGVRYASGAFWSDPTLLYVSRGVSGRHALRLNCPPELTQIVLQSPSGASTGRPLEEA